MRLFNACNLCSRRAACVLGNRLPVGDIGVSRSSKRSGARDGGDLKLDSNEVQSRACEDAAAVKTQLPSCLWRQLRVS